MIKNGTTLNTRIFGRLVVSQSLAFGGQGTAYVAIGNSGTEYILKVYHPEFQTKETRTRLERLIAQRFQTANSTIIAPRELVDVQGAMGHVSERAPGVSLESLLTNGGFDMLEGIQMACALARSIDIVHARGFAHGDIHANNILVHRDGVPKLYIIDFDNFSGKSLPAAPCLGHPLYLAPEIRANSATCSIEADRFSLAVVIHELITLRHPVPKDATEDEFNEVMGKGKWLGDPSCSQHTSEGYPATVLNADLARLFRLGISEQPQERPTAQQWQDCLYRSLFNLYVCPNCSTPSLIDASKKRCAMCSELYPLLVLRCGSRTIPLGQSSVVVGRSQLGGSPHVSARHAVIRRIGPEYRIEDCSANGVFRKTSLGWLPLPKNAEVERQPVLIAGDVLRFADVECSIHLAAARDLPPFSSATG